MNQTPCPNELELIRWVDADLPPERAQRVDEHLVTCRNCHRQAQTLRSLVVDLRSMPSREFDVAAHVRDVMCRLERPAARAPSQPWTRLTAYVGIAASLAIAVYAFGSRPNPTAESWQARGAHAGASLARDVSVQVYARSDTWRPLRPGDIISKDALLSTGLRNLGQAPAHIMLFAIDARDVVHWIVPEYTKPGESPSSVQISHQQDQRLLPSSVVFDDLVPGPMRVVTIVAPDALRVSQVENLSPAELSHTNLVHVFAAAEIREMVVQVAVSNHRKVP